MLELKIDVCQPWLDSAGILKNVLLINGIFFRLDSCQRVVLEKGKPWRLLQRTMRYSSGFLERNFDFATLAVAIVGRSSPGIPWRPQETG